MMQLVHLVRPRRITLVHWLLICIGLSVALRLPFVHAPLGMDEGGDAFIARAWATTHGSLYGAYWLDRSPVLLLFYRVAILLGGELGVRILGMLAAALVIVAVMLTARVLDGHRAARNAGLLAASLTSSVLMGGVFTGAELLAAVPSSFALLALLLALRSRHPMPYLAAAGLAASVALLTKQSFVDALLASACFLVIGARTRECVRVSGIVVWGLAFAAPIVAVLVWAHTVSLGARHFIFALFGFRVDSYSALDEMGGASQPLLHAGLPLVFATGTALLLPWAAIRIWGERHDRLIAITLGAWLFAGVVGIAAGGTWYPHYFLELAPALSVLAGGAIASTRHRRLAIGTGVLVAGLVLLNLAAGVGLLHRHPPQQRTLAVASYIHENAEPGDSLYVMYARANLMYYADLPGAYPYQWALMVRTMPDAQRRLRTMLRSPSKRPAWIVEWQAPTTWNLDRSGQTRRLIAAHYRKVATVCGKPVYLRDDRADDGRFESMRARVPCDSINVPPQLVDFVDPNGTPADSIDYIWQ